MKPKGNVFLWSGFSRTFLFVLCLTMLVMLTGCMDMAGRHWIGPKGTEGKAGFTALHSAAMKGKANSVRTLLNAGADVNAQDAQNRTALHFAAWEGHSGIVRILLDAGADPSIKNKQGFTPAELTKNVIIMNILMKAEESRYMASKKPPLSVPEKPAVKPVMADIHDIPQFKATHRKNDLAIVIGIENYQIVPTSDYSDSDAAIVKDYLKALGFQERNIECITDERATKSAFEKTIEAWLPNRAKSESSVFIYYSGHGAPEPSTGEAYIVPYDGDPNYLSKTGYSLKRLNAELGKLQVSEIVVVLDSCFSGAGGRSVLAKGARPLVMVTEAQTMPENMAVLSATRQSQISTSSPKKGHGLLTYYLLKAIKQGKKDLGEIYDYVKPLVEDEAKLMNVRQSPTIKPGREKLKGRFRLVR